MSRDARCTYAGKAYVIPEIWLAGFTRANRWQAELAESEELRAAEAN